MRATGTEESDGVAGYPDSGSVPCPAAARMR